MSYPRVVTTKSKKSTEGLPKGFSGEGFRKYLGDKKKQKEEEEARKKKNREEREKNKLEKQKKNPCSEIDPNVCGGCKKGYDNQPEDWIGCDCGQWFHKQCSNIPNVEEMEDDELEALEFKCVHCA